ncbi:hypothetical protein KBI23_04775 [bacterium]|nr:hypothetical protein [bacterium]MBP9807208.1 hypothetical protein [bacterium]
MDKHHEAAAVSKPELSFDQLMDSMSPKEIRARIRSFAKEEEEQKRQDLDKDKHAHTEKQNHSRREKEPQELTFDQALDSMSPKEVRARIRALGKEVRTEREAEAAKKTEEQNHKSELKPNLDKREAIVSNKSEKPFHMTYDKASNSYVTDDGYVLPVGPKIERLSGYMLQDQLNRVADEQAKSDKTSPSLRSASKIDPLIDLPNTALDYRALATGVPVRSLYGNGGSDCSEMSVSVDASVIGIAAGSLTIYDKQNDECRLSQTVQQACNITELLSLDVQNSSSVEEMMMKSDTVVTASDFCAETIDSVKKEKERLRQAQ